MNRYLALCLAVIVTVTLVALGCGAHRTIAYDREPLTPRHGEVALDTRGDRMRLALVGDLHGQPPPALAHALRGEHGRNPLDAIVLLGDNFNEGVVSADDPRWNDVLGGISTLGVPIFAVLGNHDYGNPKPRFGRVLIEGDPNPHAQVAFDRGGWSMPARNYVISTPLAEFVMIDTTPLAMDLERPLLGSSTAEQVTAFAAEQLRAADGRWRIVAGHHNVDHSGIMRRRSRGTHRNMARFGEVIEQLGAHLYISGHQHHLEFYSERPGGVAHLISGGGGPRPKRAEKLEPHQEGAHFVDTVEPQSAGFAILDIRPDVLEVSFHDERGPLTGESYTLLRNRRVGKRAAQNETDRERESPAR